MDLLCDLASIPTGLGLPIVYGKIERENLPFPLPRDWADKDKELGLYCTAYLQFLLQVELFMREYLPDERTILIGDDNPQVRSATKDVHNIFRQPEKMKSAFPDEQDQYTKYLPFQTIKEGAHFSPKDESDALQMADFAAFFIKKRLMKDKRAPHLGCAK